jgi:hypothetical protein
MLNILFGVSLAAWSFALHGLKAAVDKLGNKFEVLSEKLEHLAHRITVIEVTHKGRSHDEF